jgi:energy-coupling factor transport system ATP-binding protein
MIKNYHKSTGATVLLVSHSMEDVANYTEKIIVMNDAELFCHDDLEKVFSKSNEISEMGLGVPQITTIFNELKKKGFDFSSEVYTVNYAVDLILSYLKNKKRWP